MKIPDTPADEPQRIEALAATGLLDTPPEERFDRMIRVAKAMFEVPIAVLSLVDHEREWFKASCGLDKTQGPREISFCGHTILESKALVVSDTRADERLADNPRVTEDGIRFYAGHPLRTADGKRIGAFCIKDYRPRLLSSTELGLLADLAGLVENEINLVCVSAMQRDLVAARLTAERANRTKSQFLANMSHELRTPLNVIIGYAELLAETTGTARSEQELKDLLRIQHAGLQLKELIDDILDIARVEAGKMEVSLEMFDLAGVVHDVAGTMRPLVMRNRNRLVVECPEEHVLMHSDPLRVRQILFNLLANATRFTSEGCITLSVTRGRVGKAKGTYELAVQDTGVGIAAEMLETIFEPFTQLGGDKIRPQGGSGLGLSITRKLCELLGGQIEVESLPGRGSTFKVRLPVDGRPAVRTGPREAAETLTAAAFL